MRKSNILRVETILSTGAACILLRSWKLIMAFAGLLLAVSSSAIVDMKNANYADSWLDSEDKGGTSIFALVVSRYYNSRSNFDGIFGFGWCSDFETTVTRLRDGRILLTECGAGQVTTFYPADGAERATVSSTILSFQKDILARAAVSFKGDKEQLKRLEQQIKGNPGLMEKWMHHFNLGDNGQPQPRPGRALASGQLRLTENDLGGFVLTGENGGLRKEFDRDGKLVRIGDIEGNFVRFGYAEGRLARLEADTGDFLSFTYEPGGKVGHIASSARLAVQYKYSGKLLTEVRNNWGNTYRMRYDSHSRLEWIGYPDGTYKSMAYDNRGLIVRFIDRNGCEEKYDYRSFTSANHFASIATRSCRGKRVSTATFEFWKEISTDGSPYLWRVRVSSFAIVGKEKRLLEAQYHPVHGSPIEINRDGALTKFTYDAEGRLISESTEGIMKRYAWDPICNALASAETVRSIVRYEYDEHCLLNSATTSEGRKFLVTRDHNGVINGLSGVGYPTLVFTYGRYFPGRSMRRSLTKIDVDGKGTIELSESLPSFKSLDGNEGDAELRRAYDQLVATFVHTELGVILTRE